MIEEEGRIQRNVRIVIYREGDGFVAQCLDVDVASDGATEAEARENLREALELYFEEPALPPTSRSARPTSSN